MRIGFDVDGVLARFIPDFQRLTIKHAGVDLFHEEDVWNPPCWDWPQYRGYSKELMDFRTGPVWGEIKSSPNFWLDLEPMRENTSVLAECLTDLEGRHDIYYITNRAGIRVKMQTEDWLMEHLEADTPTVLISAAKGLCAKALSLDAYIDDNLDNVNGVVEATAGACKTFLLDRKYNNNGTTDGRVIRVGSVGQMLDYLILGL